MRVLVVEDEIHLAQTISDALTAEGFDVDLCHDGGDGLSRARQRRYAAIILDLWLPGMNGDRVCQALRGDGIWTPLLILAAKSGESDEAEALDAGADDCLSKPFPIVVLVARLRAALRRKAMPGPQELAAGDLALDAAGHRCRRGDVPIELTHREYTLLEALLRHSGHAISKLQLLHEVWGKDLEGDTSVVEVYVGRLRRKIDLPFGRRSLQTVRNISGYRLVSDG